MATVRPHRLRTAEPRPADHAMSRGAFWLLIGVILIAAGLYLYFNFFYAPALPGRPWPPELCCR